MTDTDNQRWERLQALFRDASKLDASDREDFLHEHCADDPGLLDEVLTLLTSVGEEDAAFEKIVRDAAVDLTGQDTQVDTDRQIGNYQLIEWIGGGGMGSVYLAERVDDQFDHRVAIKLLHASRRNKSMMQRFLAERQMLANLEHPHIARLLDGGETEDGIPFLVMEYVDGLPVDEYCDSNRLTVAERLRLFQKIADAIDYAHRNLVVHRDIKPSNILVTASGDPKLLDFGIAKYIGEDALARMAPVTLDGQSAMTPEFASPEQVRGQPISTATDIYSMGVLLYKMLCGRMPYKPQIGTGLDLAQAILEDQPSRPSTALTEDDTGELASAEHISARRGTSAIRLKSRLEGDLDNIVLMTLRKEPERRYASARALSEDIDRYLEHRPVSARADSALYRATKFARRNRVGVAVTMIVAALLTGAVFQINQQRHRASVAAAQSEQFASFLAELFAGASPGRAQGEVVTASDLLAAGVAEIDALSDQPGVQARLLDVMGASYTQIGEFERGGSLLERSLTIRESVLSRDPAALAGTKRELAQAYKEQNKLEASEQTLEDALANLREVHGNTSEDIAFLMNRLGDVQRLQERTGEAVSTLRESVAMYAALGLEDSLGLIDAMGNLSIALDRAGQLDEAERLQEQVVAASRRRLGERHPSTIIRIGNLGLIQARLGKFGPSYETISESYALMQEVWSTNPNQLTWATTIMGNALKWVGRFDEAEPVFSELMIISRRAYSPDSPRYLHALYGQAALYVDWGRYADAMPAIEEIITTVSETPDLPANMRGRATYRLAQSLNDLGDHARAEAKTRAMLAQPDGLRSTTRFVLQRELAVSLSHQGRFDEATALFEEVILGREERSGPESLGLIDVLTEASAHHRRRGEPAQALGLAARGNEIGLRITPRGTWLAATAIGEYGNALLALGQSDEAMPVLEQAHADLERTFGPADARVRATEDAIAGAGR